jgi:O-antigen ligase
MIQVTRQERHDSISAVPAAASSPGAFEPGSAPSSRWAPRVEAVVAILLFAFPLFAIAIKSWTSGIYYLIALIALFALRRPRPPLSHAERMMIGVILFYLAVTIIANSLSGWTRASVGWYEADLRILLAIPIYLYLRSRAHLAEWLLRAIPFAAIISGAYVLWQTVMLDVARVAGPYGPIFAGDMCALFAVLSLMAMRFRLYSRRINVPVHAAGFVLGLVGCLLSGTRGAWLALILVLPVLGWNRMRAAPARRRRQITLGCLAAAVVAVSAAALLHPDVMKKRVTEIVQQGEQFIDAERGKRPVPKHLGSIGTRLEQWQVGLQIAREHPLFGIGVGNVLPELKARVASGKAHPSVLRPSAGTQRGVHLHSAYVDALVFKGIVGLLALLGILGFPLWLAMRRDYVGSAAAGLLAGHVLMIAAFALTEDPFIRNNFSSIYLLFLVSAVSLLLHKRKDSGVR